MGEDQRKVPDPGGIDHEPVFAVVTPTGWQRPPGLQPAPPTAGLSGRRLGFVWDQLFNGDLVFDAIADELSRSFAGMEFVGHESFGDIHGAEEVSVLEALPDRLQQQRVDALVVGVGA
ncbi:MAG TPA: hypothetical protein VGH66_03785 [Acidimicrobiales bacterium]|jgi:hypothetical protein